MPASGVRRLQVGFVAIDGVMVPRLIRFGLSYDGDNDFVAAVAGALRAPQAWHGDVISVNQGWADRRGVTVLE